MPTNFSKVWIHAVWATKNRRPLIDSSMEAKIHKYIEEALSEIGCIVKRVNGTQNHVHVLFHLAPSTSISDALRRAKSKSAFKHNQLERRPHDLAWQNGYSVFSVSPAVVAKVDRYIMNQKIHHGLKELIDGSDQQEDIS